MKRNNYFSLAIGLILLTIIAAAYATTFTYTYDTDTPVGTDAPSVLDDRIREVKDAVQERMNVDHYFALTGSQVSDANTGEHRQITFYSSISDPTQVSSKAHLYMKSDNLYFQNDVNTAVQITAGDILKISSSDLLGTLANNTYFNAVDANGTGTVDLIGANTSDEAVIPDGSEMASSAAPTEDEDIVNKKYVDDVNSALTTSISTAAAGVYTAYGTTVFNTHVTTANTWQDLDLSSTVGSNAGMCYFEVVCGLGTLNVYMKPKGYGGALPSNHGAYGVAQHVAMSGTYYYYLMCPTNSSGILQIGANANTINITIKLISFIK